MEGFQKIVARLLVVMIVVFMAVGTSGCIATTMYLMQDDSEDAEYTTNGNGTEYEYEYYPYLDDE